MAIFLLALFIGVPLIEIAVFIQLGDLIGLWRTLALIVLTAILGAWQLRLQGIATLNRARVHLERGVLPAHELFDGLCLLVAGALLLTPGFVTDTLGFLLFLPPFRAALRAFLGRYFRVATGAPVAGEEVRPRRGDKVIEGEYEDLSEPGDDDDRSPRR